MIQIFTIFGASACTPTSGGFLGMPTWHKYLQGVVVDSQSGGSLTSGADCVVRISSINDFWLVAAAIIEIMLRIGAIAAIAVIIYAGIQYITSEGKPDKAAAALKTIISAAIGLALTVSAAALVSFVAGRF
jgi:hypothetical protein